MENDYKPQFEKQMNQETFKENPSYETPGVSSKPSANGYYNYVPYGFTPETYKEKNKIKKTAFLIGITLVIMSAITVLWGTIFFFITGKLGISYQDAYKFVSEPAVMQLFQILISTIMFTLPFVIVFKNGGKRISDLVPLEKPKKGTVIPLFLFGIAFCAFANIAVSSASDFFKNFGINYSVDMGENPTGTFGFILTLLSTAIAPALLEEFACRGIILGSLREYGDGFAILISSIIFGVLHGNFEQMPFAFLVGLVLAFIVVKSGSLWVGMAVHCFNNLISVLSDYFLSNLSNNLQNIIYTVFLIVCMVLGIFAMFLFTKNGNTYKLEESATKSSFSEKFKWFFSSVPIIIFVVVCILESCMYFKG